MGISAPVLIGASVASSALQLGNIGRGVAFGKRQERLKRRLLDRQIKEEVRLAEFREAQRSADLAKQLSIQMAALNGVGVLTSGGTADFLKESLELQAATDRARDAGSTAETINQLLVGISQSRLTQRETAIGAGVGGAKALSEGVTDAARSGILAGEK
jgi:hypothetical protein